MFNFKKALALSLVGVMSLGVLSGCGKKQAAPEEPVYELKALTADELESGKYYVKNGETFYELPAGTRNFDEKQAVAKMNQNDPYRVVWFGPDDVTIPTLYADDTLVYVASQLPDSFTWERYKDNGYSVGVTNLKINNTGSYTVAMSGINFYPGSTLKNAIAECGATSGDMLVFNAIDGMKIGSGNISSNGSILGLMSNASYKVDVYDGSTYIPLDNIVADTHVFGSFEVYTSSIANYMQANYVQVVVPDNFISGYYLINGVGFVKYVDNARAKGIADVDFNKAYYFTDDDGKTHTIDELGEDGEVVVTEKDKYYTAITNIDCSNRSMTISVTYEDAKGVNIDGSEFTYSDDEVGIPFIKLFDPDGNEYKLDNGDSIFKPSNKESNTLIATIENPIPGAWETRVYNAEKRIFTVATEFDSGHNDTLMHNGGNQAVVVYVPETMNNAEFEITWANTTVSPESKNGVVIKDGKINDPEGKKETTFTRDSVTVSDTSNYYEARGVVKLVVGAIKYGDYTVNIDSQYALGRVRVTVTDLEPSDDASTVEDSEVVEDTDTETEEVEESEESEVKEESTTKNN